MDFLTVEDSLYLLARIRGVKISHIKMIVETMSSLFLLDPFLNNYIHQLSGGTKRRLHAAIALIGKIDLKNDKMKFLFLRSTINCYS
jgi:ABC-type multidrug transport system ATPase subunit